MKSNYLDKEERLLTEKCIEIENEIIKNYTDDTGNREPILDGIVDISQYLNAKYKILWILKEPYDDIKNNEPIGGGWHLCQDLLLSEDLFSKLGSSRATWHPIVYTSYGILNDFIIWDDMSYIDSNKEMMNIVNSIAVINISKLPGLTNTKASTIENAYRKNKRIILKQIKTYNPQIIIGANTLKLLFPDLGILDAEIQTHGSTNVIRKPNSILINTYHPAQRTITRQQYVDNIILEVKDWSVKQLIN